MARVLDPPPRQDGESDTDDDYREDDDLVEASAPIIPKDEVQAAFDEIIAKARSEELNLGKKETRKEFLDKYGDVLTQKTQTNSQTLLHVIAGTVGHKSLTRCVIKKDRKLLEQKDESGKNALHLAILKRNFNFIEIALQEIPDLDKILRMTCEHMRNCIHIAIYHGLGNNDKGNGYTIKLIQRASEATLCATDQDGLTPLHIAVEYQRASEAQLSVVRALIAHGDGALDEFTTSPKGLSVYEYHQYTRSLVKKAAGPAATTARGPERSQEEPSTVATQVQKNNPMKSQPEGLSDHGNDKGVFQEPSRPKRGPGNVILPAVPSIINGRRESTALTANTIFDTPPSAFATTTEDGKSPVKGSHLAPDSAAFQPKPLERRATGFAQKNSRKDEDSARRLQEEERLREECADKIRQEFKLYYLRSTFRIDPDLNRRDQHKAARFLHGANIDNINLSFDYSEAPKRVLQESFRQSFDHMSFDEVLRYVTFRRIELQKPIQPASESKLSKRLPPKPKPGKGRSDLTFFFDWLWQKDVRHILKVIVDDLKDLPHSDQAIEESLRRFKVETLDWRKVDLCPQTLYNACRDVRELYLRWSGNRAILRAWGEPKGLPRLAQLEQVHLVWNPEQTLESADRIDQYIKDFQERLDQTFEDIDIAEKNREEQEAKEREQLTNGTAAKSRKPKGEQEANENKKVPRRKILVYRSEEDAPDSEQLVESGPSKTSSHTNERNLQSNRWLECMDNFADEIQNVKVPFTDNVILKNDIKVALIDDGADPYVESLRGKIKGGESFDRGYPHENGPSPYYTSSKGHGTVMADMICRVCPMAKLYVYKLETHPSINPATQTQTNDQISAESATLAVMAAVNQNVDIISMSWTVKETEDNRAAISSLREAIKLALDQNILLFCAAADTGHITEIEYPWAYDQRRIFRIGAATADGRMWGPTGSLQNINFILPGHKVVSRNPHREGALPDDFEERNGSSIATALAAGLAALILHCVRLGAIHSELEMRQGISSAIAVKASEFMRVKDHDNMSGVLGAIGLDKEQQRFIEVWKRFDGPTQNLKSPNIKLNSRADGVTPSELGVIAKLARDFVSGIAGGTS